MGVVLRSAQRGWTPNPTWTLQDVTAAPGVPGVRVLQGGAEVAYLTVGARTVTVAGQARTFTEQKKVGAAYLDDFGRTRTSGWGLSPFYGTWSNNSGGTLTDYPVTGSAAQCNPKSTNVAHIQTLRDDLQGADVRIRCRLTTAPAGAANSISVLSDYTTSSNHNRGRVTFNTTGALTAAVTVVNGGTETVLATQSSVITGYVANQWIWVRLWRVGAALNMSLWADGNAEPGSPTVTAVDTTWTVGRVGIRCFNSTGATNNPTYELDELAILAGTWPVPPVVTHDRWVRVLPAPFTAWSNAVELQLRRWMADTTPDALAYATAYIAGAPALTDPRLLNVGANGQPKQVLGEAKYGPNSTDGTRAEGSDFNDYIRIGWNYPNLATPSNDVNELAQQYCLDCSGYQRIVWGYWLGLPIVLDDVADCNGLNLPRRSVLIGPNGPGVQIATSTLVPVDLTNIRIGDIISFNADAADDGAGENSGDVEENDDHVGMYLGDDGDGNKLFISSRKTTNGPTFSALGGSSFLNGADFWATATRHIRRF